MTEQIKVIPDEFIKVISNIDSHHHNISRTARSLGIDKVDFDKLVIDNKEGYAKLESTGSGWCSWYLVNYFGEFYFVFESLNKTLTAQHTDIYELIKYFRIGYIFVDTVEVSFDHVYPQYLETHSDEICWKNIKNKLPKLDNKLYDV